MSLEFRLVSQDPKPPLQGEFLPASTLDAFFVERGGELVADWSEADRVWDPEVLSKAIRPATHFFLEHLVQYDTSHFQEQFNDSMAVLIANGIDVHYLNEKALEIKKQRELGY